jgi:hypothetical protein
MILRTVIPFYLLVEHRKTAAHFPGSDRMDNLLKAHI